MKVFDGDERMFIDCEAVRIVTNYQSVDTLQFRKKQSENAERMHGPQRIGGVRSEKDFLQIVPEFLRLAADGREPFSVFIDLMFRRRTNRESVARHKAEQPERQSRVREGVGTLQENPAVDD